MTQNRVTLITLGVADLAKSRAYYETLGWVPSQTMENVAFYDMYGMKFGLFPKHLLAHEQGRVPTDLGTGAMSLSQNFLTKDEVDRAFSDAIAAGAVPLAGPTATDWGGYSGYVADPDGHVWEFAMNPFWEMDEEGRVL